MITNLAPAFGRVSVEARKQDLFLQKGSWVQFSKAWPDNHKWASGNLFIVQNDPIVVTFPMSYITPGGDYVDVNLGVLPTGFSINQLNLYPAKEGVLYQIAVGLKPYDFFAQIGIPAAQNYVYRLGQSFMYPVITDPILKYLGEKTAKDSSDRAPLLFFYCIMNMTAAYLRLYALEGKAFEKQSVVFYVNKCDLQLIPTTTANYQSIQQQAPLIRWYEELTTD